MSEPTIDLNFRLDAFASWAGSHNYRSNRLFPVVT